MIQEIALVNLVNNEANLYKKESYLNKRFYQQKLEPEIKKAGRIYLAEIAEDDQSI